MYSSVNTIWVLLGAALVFLMQAGFAMCEAGFTRAKNTGNILMKNLMDFCIGTPTYWILGFGLMFAGSGALIGGLDPFVRGLQRRPARWSAAVCLSDLSDCVLRHGGYHRLRLYGRTDEIYFLLHLFLLHFRIYLPGIRPLDLGRRLAEPVGLP